MVRRPLPTGDHRSAGFSLDVGVRPSCSSFPFLYPTATGSPGTHLGLGHQRGGGPISGSALFFVPPLCSSSTRQPSSEADRRPVPPERLHCRSPVQPRQPFDPSQTALSAGLHGLSGHRGGVYACSDASKPPSVPGLFVHGTAILFSRASVRSECRSVHLHPGPCLATSMSPGAGSLPLGLPGRHCCLVPGQGHTPGADATGDVLPPGDGIQPEPRQVSSVPGGVDSLVRGSMVATVRSLASPVGWTVPHSTDGPGLTGVSSRHTSPAGADGGFPQFCVPGAPVPPPLRPAVDQEQHSGSSNRARQTRPSPSVYAGHIGVLGVSRSLAPRPALSCVPSPSLAVDGCVSAGLGSSAGACSGGLGKVVLLGGFPSRQSVGTPSGFPGAGVFRPPRPLAPCLHGQRDGSIRPGVVPRPLPESLPGAADLPVGGDLPESLVPGTPGPHGTECGGRRPQSRGASQYRVDPPSGGFRRHSALGGSSGSESDGFPCQPPPAPLGVSFSSPRRSGGGLSKY